MAKKKGVLDEYYKTREESIDFYHKLSKKIAKLRLRGISSWKPKHYKLMYALAAGVLMPPSAQLALWDPNAYLGMKNKETTFRRGLFNPHVLFTQKVKTVGSKEDPFVMDAAYIQVPNYFPGLAESLNPLAQLGGLTE